MAAPRRARPRSKGLSGKELLLARIGLLLTLAGDISGESFSPEEAVVFLFGRWEVAWRSLRRVWLREWMERTGIHALPYCPQDKNLPVPPRPQSGLSRLNRSRVFPPVVGSEAALPSVCLAKIVGVIKQADAEGATWPRLLDILVTSSAFTWQAGADIIEHIIGRRLPTEEIAQVRDARQFWEFYAEGRARMQALQTLQQLPVWQGDWAHFDRGQIADLLPGVVLADHYERHEYLANYLHEGEPALDLYSIAGQPIVRHPFIARFQALA